MMFDLRQLTMCVDGTIEEEENVLSNSNSNSIDFLFDSFETMEITGLKVYSMLDHMNDVEHDEMLLRLIDWLKLISLGKYYLMNHPEIDSDLST